MTPTDAADATRVIVATTGSSLRHHTMSGGRAPTPVRNCIGVVVTDAPEGLLLDPYYSTIFKGISSALAERSKLFMLMAPMSDSELYATRRLLIGTQVDGLILIGLHTDSWLPQFIRRRRIPAVMCGHPPADFGISGVDCDNHKGAVMAVDHLLAAGRRRIAHISGNLESPSGLDRRKGYGDALAAAGVPCDATWEALGDFHLKPARQAMERLLKNHPDLDAVFVASDEMAVVAMDVLTRAGRRIPDDVAVIGFDDSPCAARASLSTVRQSIEQTGRAAVEMLTAQIADPAAPPKLLVLDVELIVRESTTGSGGPVSDG